MECGSTYLTEVAQNRSSGDFCFARIVAERRTITVNFYHELQKLLETFGFQCRIKGDHFIYYKDGINEIINI